MSKKFEFATYLLYILYDTTNLFMKPLISVLLFSWLWIFKDVIEVYIFNDWDFAVWLGMVITLDTITGVYKTFKLKEKFTKRKWLGMVEKLIYYTVLLIVIHILVNFKAAHRSITQAENIQFIGYSSIILSEIASIFVNLAKIRQSRVTTNIFKVIFDPITKSIGLDVTEKSKEQNNEDIR